MLKITRADAPDVTTLRLEGRLVGRHVEELEGLWRSLQPTRVQLDLASLTFVDEGGVSMLGRLLRARVTVAGTSPLVRELLKPFTPEVEPKDDEADLLERLKAGEAGAHERFVRTHAARVKAVAERYLRNEEDANDVVQETFLSAFKAIGRFEGKARLATWLHRIAVNAALMKLRGQERRAEQTAEEVDELLPRFVGLGAHASPQRAFPEQPEQGMVREETRALVRSCIDRLPEAYRTALLLRDVEELDNEEVARHLGTSVNAAKIRIHRARQALRTLLEPVLGENP